MSDLTMIEEETKCLCPAVYCPEHNPLPPCRFCEITHAWQYLIGNGLEETIA